MDLGITKSGTIRHQITNSMGQYWFQLLLLCYKPPQISGIKTNIYFIMCMASVSQKFRNNIVETACLCSVTSGASAGKAWELGVSRLLGSGTRWRLVTYSVSVVCVGCGLGSQPELWVRMSTWAWFPSSMVASQKTNKQKTNKTNKQKKPGRSYTGFYNLGSHKCHFHDPYKST